MIEQHLDCTNIGTWVHDLQEGQIFRYCVYKKVFTPYEQDKKFSDEPIFEDGGYWNYAYITNVIEIPNDILIEFDELYEEDGDFKSRCFKTYRKLSDIQLVKYEKDNEEQKSYYEEEEDMDDFETTLDKGFHSSFFKDK